MTGIALLLALLGSPPGGMPPGVDPAELVPVAVPEASPDALAFYRSGVVLWVVGQAWGLAVPALILFSGLSGRIRDFAKAQSRGWWAGTVAIYALAYLALGFVADLPIDFYAGYVRPHAYGLSTQTLGRWLRESVLSLGVSAATFAAFLWVPYLLMARSPRRWWIWTGLLLLPFTLGATMIKPVWIDPLFNEFGPMKDKALERQILDLGGRAGIDATRVYEVDKSRDTRSTNAYVTGLLGTKRIVLWDTLLKGHDAKEVLAIMGHEMGHYVLNHVAWGVSLATAGSFFLLWLVDLSGRRLIARFGGRFGFDRLSDVASVPLLILLIQAFNLVGAPIPLAASRWMEHEADRFGLEITRANHSAGTSFAKLQRENLSNPRPGMLSVLWRSTHPPLGDRIEFCNGYHPWTEGKPGRYEGLFRPGWRESP